LGEVPPFALSPNASYKNFKIDILFKIALNSNFHILGVEKFSLAASERIVTYLHCPFLNFKFFAGGFEVLTLERTHLIGN